MSNKRNGGDLKTKQSAGSGCERGGENKKRKETGHAIYLDIH